MYAFEPHLVANRLPHALAALCRDARGDGYGGDGVRGLIFLRRRRQWLRRRGGVTVRLGAADCRNAAEEKKWLRMAMSELTGMGLACRFVTILR